MKNLLNFLFKKEIHEDRPIRCVIKLKSTVTPEKKLSYEEWATENRVGMSLTSREGVHNANAMMSLWDEKLMCNYIKKANF
jgi:hypothetical protein